MPPVSILAGNAIRAGKAVSGNIVVLRAAARLSTIATLSYMLHLASSPIR